MFEAVGDILLSAQHSAHSVEDRDDSQAVRNAMKFFAMTFYLSAVSLTIIASWTRGDEKFRKA